LLDSERRVIGVLAGCPKGTDWQDAYNKAFCTLDRIAQSTKPTKKDVENRRGIYPYIAYGISLGNSQTVSGNPALYPILAY